ncbi:MAG: pilus assembly protein CpaF, partial [Actinomycetota bacterium]|nr:pilus assembly protein CpaF [Actinomycetota bacterium]
MTTLDPALLEGVRRRVGAAGGPPTSARVAAAMREECGGLRGDVSAVLAALSNEIVGAGPLQELLSDSFVTDVLVNAPDEVWVDRGGGLERTTVRFPDDAAVRRLAQRLAAPTGRRLDDAQPWVDARLADGVRLHAV